MSGRLIVALADLVIFWLNALPTSPSVGGELRPRQIVTGLTVDYNKHSRLQFGKYAQVHEAHDNTMQERSIGAIVTSPNGNAQGSYLFINLATGRRMN